MVPPLLSLSALEVVRDRCFLEKHLSCIPCQLYSPLLDAAFALSHHLAITKLIQRWPERTLSIRWSRSLDQEPLNYLCVSALLGKAVDRLMNKRCRLQVLDLCGLQCGDGRLEEMKYGKPLTEALCSTLLKARNIPAAFCRGRQDKGDEIKKETYRNGGVKRDNAGLKKQEVKNMDCCDNAVCEQDNAKDASRKMELQRSQARSKLVQVCSREKDLVEIKANLFVNSQSFNQVCRVLRLSGPLHIHCRFLYLEGLSASLIISLLHLIPKTGLLGLDVRYSSLRQSELALLLPQLALFPQLCSLRLHYCNIDLWSSQQEELLDLSQGFAELKCLRRLRLTGLHLPGLLHLLLSPLSEPLELLDVRLTSGDMAYLSNSPHASSLTKLDLNDNRLEASSLRSLRRLLAQAEGSLKHLSLCNCGLLDGSLSSLLPSIGQCRALCTLRLALNLLSRAALVRLVQTAAGIQSMRLLKYPKPLEEYEPGLPAMPSCDQLLNWPLIKYSEATEATLMQLDEVLRAKGRKHDLVLTC